MEEQNVNRERCPHCGGLAEKLTMSHFSFNSPIGACASCDGLGQIASLDMGAVLDENSSLRGGPDPVRLSRGL